MSKIKENIKKVPIAAYVAAIISICLAFSVMLAGIITAINGKDTTTTDLTVAPTYNQLYSTIKKLSNSHENLLNGETTGSVSDGASSTTNNQVAGVDEADFVKNDGKHIYILSGGSVQIFESNNGKPKLICALPVLEENEFANSIFVAENRLVVLAQINSNTQIKVYNTTDKSAPVLIQSVSQSGYINTARLVDDTLFLLTNHLVYKADMAKTKPETFVPCVGGAPVAEQDISIIGSTQIPSYLVVSATNITTAKLTASESVLGGAENVYATKENLYYTFTKYTQSQNNSYVNNTVIVKMALGKEDITILADTVIEGVPLNQFSLDEHNGNLRIVTTSQKNLVFEGLLDSVSSSDTVQTNNLFVLDKNLNKIGEITNLAQDERVYSVRFSGDIGYFVTFRQVDPLFAVDLSNPEKPKILSTLKIPGFSEYLHEYGSDYLFGFGKSATDTGLVTGIKLSMFNVSDPANVTEQQTLNIEGAWSEVSENHKAIMVDSNQNIIAFSVSDTYARTKVYVYGFTEKRGFFEKAELTLPTVEQSTRFLWIDKYFYVATDTGLYAYSLELFAPTATITF